MIWPNSLMPLWLLIEKKDAPAAPTRTPNFNIDSYAKHCAAAIGPLRSARTHVECTLNQNSNNNNSRKRKKKQFSEWINKSQCQPPRIVLVYALVYCSLRDEFRYGWRVLQDPLRMFPVISTDLSFSWCVRLLLLLAVYPIWTDISGPRFSTMSSESVRNNLGYCLIASDFFFTFLCFSSSLELQSNI